MLCSNLKRCCQNIPELGIQYTLTDETWSGEYRFHGTNIWDSARRLEPGMYRPGQVQCLSFGKGKPMDLGRCGAILLDDQSAYWHLSRMRSDGRDLAVESWSDQQMFGVGFHYCPSLELCELGSRTLPVIQPQYQTVDYPDCRKITIMS
jgi:hypothetical protein